MVQTVQMYVFVQFLNKVGDVPVVGPHGSVLKPVETPQEQFLDEVMVITTGAVVKTVQTVWKCRSCRLFVAPRQIPVVLVRFLSCFVHGGRC